jgi:hypothetical protein
MEINLAHTCLVIGFNDYPDSGSFVFPSWHGLQSCCPRAVARDNFVSAGLGPRRSGKTDSGHKKARAGQSR